MSFRHTGILALALLIAGAAPLATAQEEEARATDLVERTEARLAQVDVTVLGDPEVVAEFGEVAASARACCAHLFAPSRPGESSCRSPPFSPTAVDLTT